MKVLIYEKIIERNVCISNRELNGNISKISKKLLLELETGKIPEIGEILNIEGNKYVVYSKIRMIDNICEGKASAEYFIIECKEYTGYHIYSNGSDSWGETIPLVCDI